MSYGFVDGFAPDRGLAGRDGPGARWDAIARLSLLVLGLSGLPGQAPPQARLASADAREVETRPAAEQRSAGASREARDDGDGAQGDAPAQGFAKGRALVIAIADYAKINSLPSVVLNDGKAVYEVLTAKERCGYPTGNVTLLDNANATREKIVAALEALAATAGKDSTVVIYYSGHGGRINVGGKEKAFLLPVDFDPARPTETGLSSDDLAALLAKIKADRVVVMLDACHAAGAGDLPKAFDPGIGFKAGLGTDTYAALAQGRGRVLIAACREDEYSWVLKGAANSLFTEKLLEVLRRRRDPG